ncbi:Gfo/Idh/MocA family oxidoreductase [Solidesulfovibrio sp.]|uniref:Gfo/Idh/MocA family protein n=3 Tax=Solidesulfovibrio sp. TaxID=2910990 RepID=UPI002B203631|nr:Gfo/Idh/MocA family oxidoreductase [Solidesulfovibrio sp.]MEA4855593.1 Gfo/Idh/MocA family oxidoreductase [Solidesulfovibrio sp.]
MAGAPSIGAAVIGLGNYARSLCARITSCGQYRLVACAHPDPAKAEAFCRQFGGEPRRDCDALLADPRVEAVFVLLPNDGHFEAARRCLEAGRHVFVEKPLTNSLAEARALGGLAAATPGAVCMVGHNYRRKNGIRFLKACLDEGRLGRPVHLDAMVSHGGAFHFDANHWRTDPARCLGGPLAMLGAHSLDTLRYLLGRPESVFAFADRLSGTSANVDAVTALFRMASGATASLCHHYVVPSIGYVRVQGFEGTASYAIDSNEVSVRTGRDVACVKAPTVLHTLPPLDDRLEQVVEFARAIRGRATVETGWRQGLEVVEMLHGIMESARTGQPWRFDGDAA